MTATGLDTRVLGASTRRIASTLRGERLVEARDAAVPKSVDADGDAPAAP